MRCLHDDILYIKYELYTQLRKAKTDIVTVTLCVNRNRTFLCIFQASGGGRAEDRLDGGRKGTDGDRKRGRGEGERREDMSA